MAGAARARGDRGRLDSKRAALAQADHVVVLLGGTVAAQGTWRDLEGDWGHLAG